MLLTVDFEKSAARIKEQLKFDLIKDGVAVAFFDTRGLPAVFDAEEAVRLYRKQGVAALRVICRDYACVLCDFYKEQVIFASDHVGHATFFYEVSGERVFVSERLKPIAQHTEPGIDRQSFGAYLECNFVPGRTTIFKNIFKLSPGSYLCVKKGNLRQGLYNKRAFSVPKNTEVLQKDLRDGLVSVVDRATERPTGVMLSGGFDSSLLCLFAQRRRQKLETYAIGCGEHNQATLSQAERMARFLGTKHTLLDVELKQYLAALPLTTKCMDEPVFDLDTAFIYAAFRGVSLDVKYLLHGFGSDQLIGDLFRSHRAVPDFFNYREYYTAQGARMIAGLFFIRENLPQAMRLHYRLSSGKAPRLIFPFFEHSIVDVALRMPETMRRHKKLLRSLAPSLNTALPPKRSKTGVGQIPDVIKAITLQVYSDSVMQNTCVIDLVGEDRLSSILRSGQADRALKMTVFALWVQENYPYLNEKRRRKA